jgi:hypothetical protein
MSYFSGISVMNLATPDKFSFIQMERICKVAPFGPMRANFVKLPKFCRMKRDSIERKRLCA